MVGIAEAELRTARGCFEGTTGVPERAVPVFASAVSIFHRFFFFFFLSGWQNASEGEVAEPSTQR